LLAVVAPVAHGSIAHSFWEMVRDAAKHRSPNAGWPESAMAGALGLALAGPRSYGEHTIDDPFLNEEASRDARPDDIGRALDLYIAACLLEAATCTALALVT
jgi:adenosylcobinamide-phosphate synthase